MKKAILALSVLFLAACSQFDGDTGAQGPAGPKGDTPVLAPPAGDSAVTDIAALVQDENDYRLSLGQSILSQGLSCALYSVTGGDRIQASISGHNTLQGITGVTSFLLKDVMNQPAGPVTDGLNILPAAVRSIYQNMYLLRCTGQIVVRESGLVGFDMLSDDAGLLYVDGAKVIDNDNNHGPTLVSGQRQLRRGVHSFRVDYAQTGAGSQALVVQWQGKLIDPMFLFH